VGQIVRASSKFYQLRLGVLINALMEQVSLHLENKNVFSGCIKNDAAAKEFVSKIPDDFTAFTFDTVKNESRIGPMTKAFERKFLVHYSNGVIPVDLLEQHDRAPYFIFGETRISCGGMRNSGEPGTLSRNFLANYLMTKLQLGTLSPNDFVLLKGDNTALFTRTSRTQLEKVFKPLVDLGTIEVDPSPEWTSYKLIQHNSFWNLLPNYSYIGERIFSRVRDPNRILTAGDLDNYTILFKNYFADAFAFEAQYNEFFNDYAKYANCFLFDSGFQKSELVEYKSQLLTKSQRIEYGLNKKTTTSRISRSKEIARGDGH
jgi:hypothetical protein